jgi:beta-glucosidase
MTVDTIIDERTLREIYLASFEEAIRESGPWTVMCSYNQLNGTYLSDNQRLLTAILREEWQFSGLVISDWGAVNDRVAGVTAGMDLEMPGSGGINDRKVIAAVQNGEISEAAVDRLAARILDLVYCSIDNKQPGTTVDLAAHHERARELAAQCVVLLKNERSVLPLQANQPLAVIGAFAETPRYQGGGSSHINPAYLTGALEEIHRVCPDATFCSGFTLDHDAIDQPLLASALEQARTAGCAVIFAGLPDRYESEGYDRSHINLPPNQTALITEIVKVCPRVVVVLANGSPVAMPWIDQVPAVLEGYLPGQAGGGAIADILFGQANPCGKLAETFPLCLEDNPSFLNFPDYNDRVEYHEGLYVGYRYYDKKAMPVLFPFGHGLSYTSFEYADLKVSQDVLTEDETLAVSITIKNTGKVSGAEVVQLYLAYPQAIVARVQQELKGFAKVRLAPGEKQTVTLTLNRRSFAYYDVQSAAWLVENGPAEIRIGASSRDIRLSQTIQLQVKNTPPVTFSLRTTKYDLMRHPVAAAVFGPYFAQLGSLFHPPEADGEVVQAEENPLADLEEEMALHMPLRAYPQISHGRILEEELIRKIRQCNALIQENAAQ